MSWNHATLFCSDNAGESVGLPAVWRVPWQPAPAMCIAKPGGAGFRGGRGLPAWCQAVSDAAALSCHPGLVVADEPTTALDVTTQRKILALLRTLVAARGLSLLFVTHDFGVLASICENVAGRVAEAGRTRAVLDAPRHPYTRMLLACHPDRATDLAGIPGTVPAATAQPRGCRFHPRCPVVQPGRAETVPPMVPLGQGDTRALMAAVRLGERRLVRMAAHFGPPVLADAFAQLLSRTEATVRAQLRSIFPIGTTRFADTIDSDGQGSAPLTLRLALTRTPDDRFIFDATETDDQAAGPVNLLMHPDVPGMALGLYVLQDHPGQVLNAGGPRAIDEVRLREGSLLAPRAPAPLGLRGLTMMRLLAALHGLVAVARDGNAPAAHSAYVVIALRGTAGGERFLLSDGIGVGYGARRFADGTDAGYFVAQENYPAEFMELTYPVRLRSYGLNRDSGGPGRHRGGCGVVREFAVMADQAMLAVRIDSVKNPPWGVAGGMNGGSGRAVVNPGTPRERLLAPLSDGTMLAKGDVFRIETGGGWDHPFDRPAEDMLADISGGFVSADSAARDYGVVIRDGAVDAAATAARRAHRPPSALFHRREYRDAVA